MAERGGKKVEAKRGAEKSREKVISSFVVISIVLSALAASIATVSSEEASFTFYSTASDGTLQNSGTDYTSVRNATTGSVDDSDKYGWIGQDNITFPGGTTFWIYRVGLFFDTSSLPDDCIITSATLSLYGVADFSDVDFDIIVVNGSDLDVPMTGNDYGDLLDETTSGGAMNTADFITGGYNDISLNTIGLSWINKTGITKFGLRSSRDINGNTPSSVIGEYVKISLYERGSGYQPKLTVNYREATGSIVGRITYACNGTGIAGVTVNLTHNGSIVNSTTTDSNGNYTFTDVNPGDYYVKASKRGFWDNSTEVAVIAGETTEVNMMLWLKGDLNNNGIPADIGDVAMMWSAWKGEITADYRYDLNNNGIPADIGDVAMMWSAWKGEIILNGGE